MISFPSERRTFLLFSLQSWGFDSLLLLRPCLFLVRWVVFCPLLLNPILLLYLGRWVESECVPAAETLWAKERLWSSNLLAFAITYIVLRWEGQPVRGRGTSCLFEWQPIAPHPSFASLPLQDPKQQNPSANGKPPTLNCCWTLWCATKCLVLFFLGTNMAEASPLENTLR